MATWKRELDVIECLCADDKTIRSAWRQYIKVDGGQIEGFARFVEAWTAQGLLRAIEVETEVPAWRLKQVLRAPETDEAERILLTITDAGVREAERNLWGRQNPLNDLE